MSCEHLAMYVLSDFRSAAQLQSPCSCTEIAENYLKPGLKPSGLNLCSPPSTDVTELTPSCCFTIRPDLGEAQLTSRKWSHSDLVSFHSMYLIDFQICHDMYASGSEHAKRAH